MSDWNPQVVVIEKVEHHPNADALDVCTVLGDYPVIAKRDEYKVGDLAGYIPIDSIVPDTSAYHFLCPKAYEKYEDENGDIQQRQLGPKFDVGSVPEKYRIIKAKKIRNIYSQGMLVSLPEPPASFNISVFDILGPFSPFNFLKNVWKLGDSLTDVLNLKKWEEQEEDNIELNKKPRGANQESPPKGWAIPYYDIEGLRKYLACLQEGEEIVLTEKIHGSNFAACHDGERLWVKSRNFYKKRDEDDPWWDAAIRLELEEKLAQHPNYVFFGELYGTVKGFRYDCVLTGGKLDTNVRFFDIYDTKIGRYLDYETRVALLAELGLDGVPELYRGQWTGKDLYSHAEGKSTLNDKHVREGFVLCTLKERFEPRLNSRMQVKLVGEGYNLSK